MRPIAVTLFSCALLVASFVLCMEASEDQCSNPIVMDNGIFTMVSCFKQQVMKNGLKQVKMSQVIRSATRESILKVKRTLTEELVRCDFLSSITFHSISDFDCTRYEAFSNDSISKSKDNALFMKKSVLRSKRESLGMFKGTSELHIYPFNENTINQQVSPPENAFLKIPETKKISTNGAYFIMKNINPHGAMLSGDVHLTTIESESLPLANQDYSASEYPEFIVWLGYTISNALNEEGYMLSLKNIVLSNPILGEGKIYLNFTIGQQNNFPFFFLENSVSTNIPKLFDYNASITQEHTSDRYNTSGAYSTRVNIDAISKIPELNFSLRQKFENSGSEVNQWYETMLLNTRHFSADVLSIVESGFFKRLSVRDKLDRKGMEIRYSDSTDNDAIDFKIQLKKSVLNDIVENFVQGFMDFWAKKEDKPTTYQDSTPLERIEYFNMV